MYKYIRIRIHIRIQMNSKSSEIKKDIELLNKGILPDNFKFAEIFANSKNTVIDLNKLKFNAFYKSYEYHTSKFPDGHTSIPGFDKIIDSIAENSKTPLEEMIERERERDEKEKENIINKNKNLLYSI
jgi:hypothetical protein